MGVSKRLEAALMGAALMAAALAAPAEAQDAEAPEAVRKVQALGAAIGNVFVCKTTDEELDLYKEEAHHLFDLIVQDAGSDMAFHYATAVGFGAAAPADQVDCARILEQWSAIREDYDLAAAP